METNERKVKNKKLTKFQSGFVIDYLTAISENCIRKLAGIMMAEKLKKI